MKNFRPVDRDTGFLMPPSVDEWLLEKHLVRFVVEMIVSLDLRAMLGSYPCDTSSSTRMVRRPGLAASSIGSSHRPWKCWKCGRRWTDGSSSQQRPGLLDRP